MTNEQATDILSVLTSQMEINGYGEILRQVRSRLEEITQFDQMNASDINSRYRLKFYLDQSIEILQNISSKKLSESISSLNKILSGGLVIEQVRIELIDRQILDMNTFPNYDPVIEVLEQIREELNNE